MKTIFFFKNTGILFLFICASSYLHAQPTKPLLMTGFTSAIKGSEVTYSVQGSVGAAGYYWTYPAGWRVIRGQGSRCITFITDERSAGGTVAVEELRKDITRTASMPVVLIAAAAKQPDRLSHFDVRVFPTASHSHFTVQNISDNAHEPIRLRVVDLLGRTVETQHTVAANSLVRLGDTYQPGIYVVDMVQGDISKQMKIVKQ